MPSRQVASAELAQFLKILAHPDRIRLIETLREKDCDVGTLASILGIPSARVSQHLALMRAHRLVDEHREHRNRLYHLKDPELAAWIVEGLSFLEKRIEPQLAEAIQDAREQWTASS